jgi:peptidoglycan-N-acetylglucosamine deacetylase
MTAPNFTHVSIDVDYLHGTERALKPLLEHLLERECKPSLFVAGKMAPSVQTALRLATESGCEVGVHGWAHCEDGTEDFRILPRARQRELVARAQHAVYLHSGQVPRNFRAPNLWMSETTLEVIGELGFTLDSSIPSGRIDVLMGRIQTTRYLRAPMRPYEPSTLDITKEGRSGVLEVPLSNAIVPINMMSLRCFGPRAVATLARALARRNRYVQLYCHPAEFMSARAFDRRLVPVRHRLRVGPGNFGLLTSYLQVMSRAGLVDASLSGIAALCRPQPPFP